MYNFSRFLSYGGLIMQYMNRPQIIWVSLQQTTKECERDPWSCNLQGAFHGKAGTQK